MSIDFQPIVAQSLAKQIAEQLREAILSGQLLPDQRLPTEGELAQRFQVSRPTIREALKRLAAQNLIRSRRGPTGGTFVSRPSFEQAREALTGNTTLLVTLGEFDLDQVSEARLELERTCVRLCAQRADDQIIRRLDAEIALQSSPGLSHEDFCASDVRFHRAMVDGSGNAMLRYLMNAVIEALLPIENRMIFLIREREKVVQQHKKLRKAIARGDVDEAVKALEAQMRYRKKNLDAARKPETPSLKSGDLDKEVKR